MHVIHRLHSDFLSLGYQYAKEIHLFRRVLYFMIALQCFICLSRCSESHISAIKTLTIDENLLHGNDPIVATSKVVIIPGDSRCKSRSLISYVSPILGLGIKLLTKPLYLLAYLFHGFGYMLKHFFGGFVWILESALSQFWCYPGKGSFIHKYREEGIFNILDLPTESTLGPGKLESIIEWLHSHLHIILTLLGLPIVFYILYKLLSVLLGTGFGGDTLLKINKDGNWEYAPSSKKAVVNYKYGSFNSPKII